MLPTTTIHPRSLITQSSGQYPFRSRNNQKQYQQPYKWEGNGTYQKQNDYQNIKRSWQNDSEKKIQQINPCLICNRNNHPTIKCF